MIGSLPTGYLVVRLTRGIDIRTVGSGSIGATNVRCALGQGWAVFVTIVDMSKGALALLLAAHAGTTSHELVALSAFAAVVGHNYPIWLKFRGGKGVATTYGTMFFVSFFTYNSQITDLRVGCRSKKSSAFTELPYECV